MQTQRKDQPKKDTESLKLANIAANIAAITTLSVDEARDRLLGGLKADGLHYVGRPRWESDEPDEFLVSAQDSQISLSNKLIDLLALSKPDLAREVLKLRGEIADGIGKGWEDMDDLHAAQAEIVDLKAKLAKVQESDEIASSIIHEERAKLARIEAALTELMTEASDPDNYAETIVDLLRTFDRRVAEITGKSGHEADYWSKDAPEEVKKLADIAAEMAAKTGFSIEEAREQIIRGTTAHIGVCPKGSSLTCCPQPNDCPLMKHYEYGNAEKPEKVWLVTEFLRGHYADHRFKDESAAYEFFQRMKRDHPRSSWTLRPPAKTEIPLESSVSHDPDAPVNDTEVMRDELKAAGYQGVDDMTAFEVKVEWEGMVDQTCSETEALFDYAKDDLVDEIVGLRNRLAALEKDRQKVVDFYCDETSSLKAQLQDEKDRWAGCDEHRQAIIDDRQLVIDEMRRARDSNAELRQAVAAAKDEAGALQARLYDERKMRDREHDETLEVANDLKTANEEIEALYDRCEQLEFSRDAIATTRQELSGKLGKANQTIVDLYKDSRELNRRIAELITERNAEQIQVAKWRSKAKDLDADAQGWAEALRQKNITFEKLDELVAELIEKANSECPRMHRDDLLNLIHQFDRLYAELTGRSGHEAEYWKNRILEGVTGVEARLRVVRRQRDDMSEAFHQVADDNVELQRGLVKLGHLLRNRTRALKACQAEALVPWVQMPDATEDIGYPPPEAYPPVSRIEVLEEAMLNIKAMNQMISKLAEELVKTQGKRLQAERAVDMLESFVLENRLVPPLAEIRLVLEKHIRFSWEVDEMLDEITAIVAQRSEGRLAEHGGSTPGPPAPQR